MTKVIQSLRPLSRAPAGILGQLWFPNPDGVSPFSSCSISPVVPPFPSMTIFLIPFVLCHPSVAPAVVDTPEMCLNLNCMANLLPKASDPEGQRKCVRTKNRTSSPVSIAPQKRTFSPWSVPPQSPDCLLPAACPQCQSRPTSLSRLPQTNSPLVEEQ